MRWIKVKCEICNVVFIATDIKHHIDSCPKCKSVWIDYDKEYSRFTYNLNFIEEFGAPWFNNEDDYHSALMSWLNDSDEEYYMFKEKGVLMVAKR